MGKAPKPPPAPDPYQTSAANQQGNVQTAIAQGYMSNPNVNSTFGSSSTKQTGTKYVTDATGKRMAIPTFTVTQKLSPSEQAKYNLDTDLSLRGGEKAQEFMSNINTDKIDYRGLSGGYDEYRDRAEDALRARYQPTIDRNYETERTRLVNQGVTEGTGAWTQGLEAAIKARTDADLGIIQAGGAEADRAFSQDMAGAQFENQVADLSNNQSLNQLNALRSGLQVTAPQFQAYQPGQIAPTSVGANINNAYNQQMQGYQAQSAAHNAKMGGLFSLGGALLTAPFTGGASLMGGLG